MSQTVIPLAVKLVQTETAVPFGEVVARLDREVNKAGCHDIQAKIQATQDQAHFEALIQRSVGEIGFLYFSDIAFHNLIERREGTPQPEIVTYIIGNPLYAQDFLQQNRLAAYNIPLKLLIASKPDKSGTVVIYHLPSSVIGEPDGNNALSFQKQIDILDKMMGDLVCRITGFQESALQMNHSDCAKSDCQLSCSKCRKGTPTMKL